MTKPMTKERLQEIWVICENDDSACAVFFTELTEEIRRCWAEIQRLEGLLWTEEQP